MITYLINEITENKIEFIIVIENMNNKIITIFLILFTGLIQASGQNSSACFKKEMNGFIKDGPDYSLTLEDSKTGKIYVSFFEGFQYRLIICSSNTKKFKISLFDIEKNLLFSGTCENYIKTFDLKFKSNIACIAEIKVDNIPSFKPVFSIAIGFKDDQAEK